MLPTLTTGTCSTTMPMCTGTTTISLSYTQCVVSRTKQTRHSVSNAVFATASVASGATQGCGRLPMSFRRGVDGDFFYGQNSAIPTPGLQERPLISPAEHSQPRNRRVKKASEIFFGTSCWQQKQLPQNVFGSAWWQRQFQWQFQQCRQQRQLVECHGEQCFQRLQPEHELQQCRCEQKQQR